MPDSFKVGQAPWETGNTPQSFAVGKAPWETPVVASPIENPQQFKFDISETRAEKIQRLQQESASATQDAKSTGSFGGIIKNFGTALRENFLPSESGLGRTISSELGGSSREDLTNAIAKESDNQIRLLKIIRDNESKGIDATKYKKMYNGSVDSLQISQKLLDSQNQIPTTGQVAGQLGGTALDVLTAGTYGKATTGMKAFELAPKGALLPTVAEKGMDLIKNPTGIFSASGMKAVLKGTGIGYAFDVSKNLQEGDTGLQAAVPGLGTAIGFGIPSVIESVGTVKNLFSAPKYLQDLKNDWTKVGGDFVKSSKILDKAEQRGKNPIDMLSERGITPQSTVDNTTGKFATREAADKIALQDTQPFEEVLQSSLKEADMANIPIAVADPEKIALQNVANDTSLTVGQKQSLIQKVKDEFSLLSNEHPEGISRVDSNVEKRKYWQNTKFDRSNALERDFYYQMGKAFKQSIEKNTPDVNVQGLNSYLGDLYESSKFLLSLDGKVPKISVAQKIQRGITKAVTTFVGAKLGGGLPGGAAGYVVGNSISHALESMSNPLKTYFLSRLRVENPAAYEQAVRYLGEQESARLTRLHLPAPKPLGSSGNPIIPPAPTTYELMAQQINNPKYLNVKSTGSETKIPLTRFPSDTAKLPVIQIGKKPVSKFKAKSDLPVIR